MFTHPLFPVHYEPWQAFISANPNYTLEWGGSEKQEKWGRSCLAAVQRAAMQFAEPSEANSLEQIYDFCAWERLKIARALSHELAYGRSRLNDDLARRISPFSPDRLRTKDQFEELKSRFEELKSKSPGLRPMFELFPAEDSEVMVVYEGIEVGIVSYEPFYKHDDRIAEVLTVRYPFSKEAKQLLKKADEIWQKTFSEKDNLSAEEKYKRLGKILWLLAFACPLEKGSAATSEMVFHLLCHKLGLPLLPIKSDKSWDIYALFTKSPEEFADFFYKEFIYPIDETDYQHYRLPMIEQDNTETLQQEVMWVIDELHRARKLQNKGFKPKIFEADCKATDLQDPYGLSLFHYWYLKDSSRDTDKISESDYYSFPWIYLINGENLFFDSLKNNALDPFVFLADLGKWRCNNDFDNAITEQKCLLNGLQIIGYMSKTKEELDVTCLKVLDKILTHATLVYMDYDPDLTKELSALQQRIKEGLIIDLSHLDSLMHKIEKQNLAFSFPHLMYLAKYYDCELAYYRDLPLAAWVKKRDELQEKSLLEEALVHKNDRLLIAFPYRKISSEEVELLVDAAMELESSENKIFLLSFLFSDFSAEKMTIFMSLMGEKYAGVEAHFNLALFSLCQTKDYLYKEKVDSFFKVFLASAKNPKETINSKDSDGKSPLYYAFLNKKTFIVEQLIQQGAKFDGILISIHRDMREGINHILCSSNQAEVKGKILLKISDEILNFIFEHQTSRNSICEWYNKEKLVHFCEGVNWAVAAQKTPKSDAFFHHEENHSDRLKKNVVNILDDLIKEGKVSAVASYLTHLNVLELEDYKKLKVTLDPLEKIFGGEKLRKFLEEKINSLERLALQKR